MDDLYIFEDEVIEFIDDEAAAAEVKEIIEPKYITPTPVENNNENLLMIIVGLLFLIVFDGILLGYMLYYIK